MIKILYQDDYLIAVFKPAGFFVHPPEDKTFKVPRERICLYAVRKLAKQRVYPLHRLDVATSGILIFGKSPEVASQLGKQFQEKTVTKKYIAVVRGWLAESGVIDQDLLSDSSDRMLPSVTEYSLIKKIELPIAVGTKHSSSRYSFLEVFPKTGRFHQIRRHFNRISHPLIGDGDHGDSRHNRFFRESLGIPGLCLANVGIEFSTPWQSSPLVLQLSPEELCQLNPNWTAIYNLFQLH